LDSGSVHDLKAADPTLASVRVPQQRGRPKTRPQALAADRGYDSQPFRRQLSKRGIRHAIPRRKYKNKPHLPLTRKQRRRYRHRWKVERSFSWLNGFRRITLRFEYYSALYAAFLTIAVILLCLRRLLQ
jgi:IS5 family transposase